jgi:hypothetical protein
MTSFLDYAHPPPTPPPRRSSFIDFAQQRPMTPPPGTKLAGRSFIDFAPQAQGQQPAGGVQGALRGMGSALGWLGNVLDVPLAYGEATLRDLNPSTPPGQEWDKVTKDLQTGGIANVAENDVYFRKGSLDRVIADPKTTPEQKARAKWFLAHPKAAGVADFLAEFLNPSNLAGGLVGKGVGAAANIPKVAHALEEFQANTRLGNRFAGMRAAGRDVGIDPEVAEKLGRDIVGTAKASEEEAYPETKAIFGDMTPEEQREIVHRMQGNRVTSFGAKDAEIDARAEQLRTHVWRHTRDQIRQGTLPIGRVFGRQQMFPGVFDDVPEGQVRHTLSDAEDEEIARRARTGERPTVTMEHPNLTPDNAKRLTARNDALNSRANMLRKQLDSEQAPSGEFHYFPMRSAFNQPGKDEEYLEYLAQHTGSGIGKNAYRAGTGGKNAPRRQYKTLLEAKQDSTRGIDPNWSPADSYYKWATQRGQNIRIDKAMDDAMGLGLVKPASERTAGDRFAEVGDLQAARMYGAPNLKDKAIHQRLANLLEEAGATRGDASAFAESTTALGKIAGSLNKVYQTSQSLLRQGVIANPLIHGGWNLMFQYLGAGGDLRYLAQANRDITKEAAEMGARRARGAPQSISGGSRMAEAVRPYKSLNPLEKVARFGAEAQEWNARTVFDRMEPHYVNALYKTYIGKGMSKEAAGNQVRRVLGDYANVSNAGIDKVLKQMFFFYPWLKTILPFWIKTGAVKPQTWNPAIQGIATQNELSGDPNYGTPNETPFTYHTGADRAGRPTYWGIPMPQRILGQAAQLGGGIASNNATEAKKGFQSLFLNRLNPVTSGAFRGVQQLVQGAQDPLGPFGYAPAVERAKAGVQQLGDYVPGPVRAGYDFARDLIQRDDIPPATILGELIGGTGYAGMTEGQRRAARSIKGRYYHRLDTALRRGDKQGAWQVYQEMQKALQGAHIAPLQQRYEMGDETNPMPEAPPTGAVAPTGAPP